MRRCIDCGRRHIISANTSNRLIDALWFVTIVLAGLGLYVAIQLFR